MNLAAFRPLLSSSAWRGALAVAAANLAVWTVLSALAALAYYNDDLRRGVQGSFWLMFVSSARTSFALACLSCLVYLGIRRWPAIVANARHIVAGYAAMLAALLLLQSTQIAQQFLRARAPHWDWPAIEAQVAAFDRYAAFLHWTSVTAVYFAVVAVVLWRQNQERRLQIERQHGLALRAQLEPHFMFNALNAISALVRTDSQELALDGIGALGDLLRYALAANGRDWVTVDEELAFIGDYLALQRMRYGARLHVAIGGDLARAAGAACPPLLLQPLVENALRHDLDCHDEACDIRLDFARAGGMLTVCISNSVHPGAAPNPGTGLGLSNTAERLRLAYGGKATLQARQAGGRFEVTLTMPDDGS